MELGIAYLWVGDYELAEHHFQKAMEAHPARGDTFYSMAGTAQWCVDNAGAAVKHWCAGLSAPYTVGGVGIQIPLLLFLTSVLRPCAYLKEDAIKILEERTKNAKAELWPGPLAGFILGKIDDARLEIECFGYLAPNERGLLRHRKWLSEFYRAVLALDSGDLNLVDFRQEIGQMVDTSQPEWSDEGSFLSLLWSAEFFIARNEAPPHRS